MPEHKKHEAISYSTYRWPRHNIKRMPANMFFVCLFDLRPLLLIPPILTVFFGMMAHTISTTIGELSIAH